MYFVSHVESLAHFLPWKGKQADFYGHPGMMNLLYFQFGEWFGKSIVSLRLFCLLMSGALLVVYYSLLKSHVNRFTALFAGLSFLALPMFQVQSLVFYNELGSFALALGGLFFYFKRQYWLYALFASAAFLYLESSLAYSLAVIIVDRKSGTNWWALLTPMAVAILFFFLRGLAVGEVVEHGTQELVMRRLMNPWLILREINWFQLASARWYTLADNVSAWMAPVLVVGGLLPFVGHRRWQPPRLLWVLFVGWIFQLLFFSLLSTEEGGRDFFSGFLLLFAGIYFLLSCLTAKKWLVGGAGLVGLLLVSGMALGNKQHSWFYTSFYDYQKWDSKKQTIRQGILSLGEGPFLCHAELNLHNFLFCSDFFGERPDNIQQVGERNQSTFTLTRQGDERSQGKLNSRGYVTESTHELGPLFDEVPLLGVRLGRE